MRSWHKWMSLVLTLFLLVFVLSGIVMNHRDFFSSVDVPRKYLPAEYHYNNWNNAAIRGAFSLGGDSLLVYGNIGAWLTDTAFTYFQEFNSGFPEGVDNRKINKVLVTDEGKLLAGTLFGLYTYSPALKQWVSLDIPAHDQQVVDLVEAGDSLMIMTRSYLFSMEEQAGGYAFRRITLPPPAGYRDKTGLFKTLWVIHSGEIGGVAGKLFVDVVGLLFAFLGITGIVYWLFPGWIRRRKRLLRGIEGLKQIYRFSVKWHNKVGVWAVVFLLVTTITGMFLRPPLLIAIANAEVGKIPFSVLDDPNPWYDQLRRIIYEEHSGDFIVGTNSGIYYAEKDFEKPLLPFGQQPPVSVMGINVFEHAGDGAYLVGSFNGLFVWNPRQGWMIDYFSPGKAVVTDPSGSPLGEYMAAGLIRAGEKLFVFDYNHGLTRFPTAKTFLSMPEEVIEKSPMSLWNVALELHTGRIYSILFGRLYILFIPLFGLGMIVVLVTGLWLWWKVYRKRRQKGDLI